MDPNRRAQINSDIRDLESVNGRMQRDIANRESMIRGLASNAPQRQGWEAEVRNLKSHVTANEGRIRELRRLL